MNSIEKLKLTSKSYKETIDIGYNIGLNLDNSDVVLLYGEMGAGKTRITAGIAKGIGSEMTVRSPTFVIINEYPGPKILFHCDFYRLNNLFEAYDLDIESRFDKGIVVVEWPDTFEEIFTQNVLKVKISIPENPASRNILLESTNKRTNDLIANIKQNYEK